jgi:predicted secreted protein
VTQFPDAARVRAILAEIKPLAAEYYRLTGKPLGVTGEVAEYVAAETLGLELAPARTAGYDALRNGPEGVQRIQIKGRAYGADAKPGQRLGRIKRDAVCDTVMLVLLDNATLALREIWEAPYPAVVERLDRPGSKARERGALGVAEFKRLARRIWPT